jgi:hypothetical protein
VRESGGDDRSPEDDAAQVRAAVDTIRIAIQLDDWKTVYHSFSDAFREQCAEDDFVASATQRAASFKVMANLKAGEVVVDGDNATAEIILSGGEQNAGEWPFVREGGEWYLLSAEGIEGCGFATPTPTPPPVSTP